MRHLVAANNNGFRGIPHTIAELGPGDSIGLGLAALLSGCERYYALDVYKYWDAQRNILIFDELVELFRNKTSIPDITEFPRVIPVPENYDFPIQIFTEEHLQKCLKEERIKSIRDEILNLEKKPDKKHIHYFIPWYAKDITEPNSVDLIISQAVLQYIDDLDLTYATMHTWLKQGGIMSHSIDFSSHGTTKKWNGHWTYSKLEWKLVRGKRSIGLNRVPYSVHLKLNEKYNFTILKKSTYKKENQLSVKELSKEFKNLGLEDKTVAAMFIQSIKK
jgi:SAM-dependent methyltransferase